MAEDLLAPILLQGNATAVSNVRRFFYAKNNELNASVTLSVAALLVKYTKFSMASSAMVSGRFVKVVKSSARLSAKASIAGQTTVASNAHKYKTVKIDLNSQSTLETYIYDRDI